MRLGLLGLGRVVGGGAGRFLLAGLAIPDGAFILGGWRLGGFAVGTHQIELKYYNLN